MTDWTKLLSQAEVKNAIRERKKTYEEKTTWRVALDNEAKEGWYYVKDTANPDKVKVHKDKTLSVQFENRLWVLFATMGFSKLNRDAHFEIEYTSNGTSHKKQIDVFAVDEETVLVVECKCAEKPKDKPWKTEIEAIHGYMQGVRAEINKMFPNRNVKFIFATKNYIVGKSDKDLMEQFGIAHFDEKTIKYYEDLVKHLGSCARYQLLGGLFANKEIKGMDNRIPAIKGKMGGYTYYVFSIQPEILLKIGYVLHRSEANDGMMPTYQRIIKKARLKSVHDFIENRHGFFPNSLLISVDTKKGKPLQFDLSDKQGVDNVTQLGILHLPNVYRSAYIIDGQHRLYGYSDSKNARTNSIPVVAFENMDQKQQVKLFMEINENQKAVSKNLRNTLNADLLWVSDNPIERREAIRSRIAQDLGDSSNSPLCNRVIIGEDQSDEYRCITLEMICSAIKDTSFLTKFCKDKTPSEYGNFDLDDNDKTLELLEKYLIGCFSYLKELLPEEWEKNPKQDGILLFNNAIGGLIRLFNDIAIELINAGYDPKKIDDFLEETHYYLEPLQDFFRNMSADTKQELRASYGGNGPKDYWRNLERAVHNAHDSFVPEGYIKYWEDHDKSHNEDSIRIMATAEQSARIFIVNTLKATSTNWIQEIPKKVYTSANNEKSKHEYDTGESKEISEFFTMSDLCEIIMYGPNWSTLFENVFTLPSQIKLSGGKKAKTEWMHVIDKLQKNVGRANFNVTKSQREMLLEVETLLPFSK